MGAEIISADSYQLRRALREFIRALPRAYAGQSGIKAAILPTDTQVRFDDGSVDRAALCVWFDADSGRVVRHEIQKLSMFRLQVALR